MAEPTGQGGKPKPKPVDLSPDEVIDDIVAHFKGLQGVTVLIGYLGDSPKGPTYVRFYFDLSLATFCDILKTDIVRRERIERTDDADASKIFVKRQRETPCGEGGRERDGSNLPQGAHRFIPSHGNREGDRPLRDVTLHRSSVLSLNRFGRPGVQLGVPVVSALKPMQPAGCPGRPDCSTHDRRSIQMSHHSIRADESVIASEPVSAPVVHRSVLQLDEIPSLLLELSLLDASMIIEGELTVSRMARRNANFVGRAPGRIGLVHRNSRGTRPSAVARRSTTRLSSTDSVRDIPRPRPSPAPLTRLVYSRMPEAILVFDLVPDAIPLGSLLADRGEAEVAVTAAWALGETLGAVHRAFDGIDVRDPRLEGWLPRSVPWGLQLHEPNIAEVALIGPAVHEALRILQDASTFGSRLDRLRREWRPSTLIHGDIRFDNVLVRDPRAQRGPSGAGPWIVNWEMVQHGDPAWDLAGALQGFLVWWVSSMPLSEDLTAEERVARASWPLSSFRPAISALWAGYREGGAWTPRRPTSSCGMPSSSRRPASSSRRSKGPRAPIVSPATRCSCYNRRQSARRAGAGAGPVVWHRCRLADPMIEIHDDLMTVLDSVEVHSSTRFSVLGIARDIADSRAIPGGTTTGEDWWARHCASEIYERLYKRPDAGPGGPETTAQRPT